MARAFPALTTRRAAVPAICVTCAWPGSNALRAGVHSRMPAAVKGAARPQPEAATVPAAEAQAEAQLRVAAILAEAMRPAAAALRTRA